MIFAKHLLIIGCLIQHNIYIYHAFLQVLRFDISTHDLCSSSGDPYEFIPLDWLKKWLDDSTATKEIDNSLFLCCHNKLHPDKVGESKRVSLQAAELLYKRYGGGPRLDSKSVSSQAISCCQTKFCYDSSVPQYVYYKKYNQKMEMTESKPRVKCPYPCLEYVVSKPHSVTCVCADSSMCRECVSQRCRVLRLKNQLNEDYKEVSNMVKRSLR